MDVLIDIFMMLANAANMLVIIWFIIGLLFSFNVIGRDNTFFVAVHDAIARLFEPILRPIRRLLPDTGAIDFSPMVLLLLIYAIIIVLESVRGV
ncbi:YggT family protein [Altererythrobacter sp. TH136]|uniref:YggT family protein n=1 Tax=Altererythrobacter sp. TH136 TaxID=2067415 RepID=UPI0011621293|nr:YggT family protein [Altererythrobacter sp. TH136]QDM41246.1 YggT family protein [Altererythrobacter sp. TH136]